MTVRFNSVTAMCRFLVLIAFGFPAFSIPVDSIADPALQPDAMHAVPVRIGVLAHRGLANALKAWLPTAQYLTKNISNYEFSIVPLSNDTIETAVKNRQVEFILTNPASYAGLEANYGVSRLVTLRNLRAGQSYTKFGALIFTRADRSDITTLQDLKGKSFMAVHPNAFGGWWMAWRELHKKGIDPQSDFKFIRFSGFPQDKIVYAVQNGEVDAGTIRTDMLERMDASGLIDKHKFKVLNTKFSQDFQFLHSTELYPEWPFSTLRSTPATLAHAVTIALLKMPENHNAAKAAKISGWTVAQDYHPVHELMKELRVGPYKSLGNIRIEDIASQYGHWLWSFIVVMSLAMVFIVYVTRLNKKLTLSHQLLMRESNERMKAEDESARLGSLLDDSSNEILIFSYHDYRFIQVNKGALRHLGYSMEEMQRLTPMDIHHEWSLENFLVITEPLRIGRESRVNYEATVTTKSGDTYQIEAWLHIGRVDDMPVFVAVLEDITARKNAERDLYMERQKAKITLQSIGDAVITTDKLGRIEYMNPIAESMTGWSQSEAQGKAFSDVVRLLDSTTNSYAGNPVARCLNQGEYVELDDNIMLLSRDNRRYPVHQTITPRQSPDGTSEGVVLVFRDVAELRRLQHEMKFQATHDDLTNLNNRRAFQSLLTTILAGQTKKQKCTLLYLDLDQFKIINDTCGHRAGDELLKEVAVLFEQSLRSSDTVARLGGDEFAILLRQNCQLNDAKIIANKIIDSINDMRFNWEGRQFQVGVSIGIVSVSENVKEITEALSMADSACYMAKELGRNRYYIYSSDDERLQLRQGEMHCMQAVKYALTNDTFDLCLQPIQSLSTPSVVVEHFEVLLRMYKKNGEWVYPSAFIPAAERYQLMPQIDRWVVHHVLLRLSRDPGLLSGRQKLALNISGQSLADTGFTDYVLKTIAGSGVPGNKLVFEITETAAIQNFDLASQFIDSLREIGCHFSLDDFGSGMSSFPYLQKLKVDYLKIDGSLVENMAQQEGDFALVKAISGIGKNLGLTVVAEFVKDRVVLEKVKELNIDMAQGYVFGKPALWKVDESRAEKVGDENLNPGELGNTLWVNA